MKMIAVQVHTKVVQTNILLDILKILRSGKSLV